MNVINADISKSCRVVRTGEPPVEPSVKPHDEEDVLDLGTVTVDQATLSSSRRRRSGSDWEDGLRTLVWDSLPLVALLIGGALALGGSVALLSLHPSFQVHDVRVTGDVSPVLEESLDLVQSLHGEPLVFLSLKKVAREIQDNPWVQDVSLRRVIPGTLHVALTERKPVAVLNGYYIDATGMVIAQAPPRDRTYPEMWIDDAAALEVGTRMNSDAGWQALEGLIAAKEMNPPQPGETLEYAPEQGWVLSSRSNRSQGTSSTPANW